MSGYTVAVFFHVVGVIVLFGGIMIQQRVAARLRSATTLQEVRLWMGFLRSAAGMLPAAVVILLASGLYMMVQSWSLRTPFVAVGLVTLLLMAGVGAGFVGRRLAAIGRAAGAETSAALTPDIAGLIHAPATWIALSALNGAASGCCGS